MKKLLSKVLGTTTADAAWCIDDCGSWYEYRCGANNLRQRRLVTVYGCYCQYKRYGTWYSTGLRCPV